MKAILTGLLLALLHVSPVGAADAFTVEIIRDAPLKKDSLFTQTLLWMAESFKSSKEVIDLKDKGLGVIIGNGAVETNIGLSFLPVTATYTFKLRIDIKDNKYRMTFSQVHLLTSSGGPKPIEATNRESNEPEARQRFNELADSLDAYLAKPRKDF